MTECSVHSQWLGFYTHHMADSELDARLDTVKKGYDPQQVRQLVAMLSAELKKIDAENERLRHELDLAKLNTSVNASRATDDIISSWTRETNDMLEGARQHVSRIMEKANTEAAALLHQADADAAATRQRAQVEANQLLTDARAEAAAIESEAEQRGAAALQAAEQRSASVTKAAELRENEAAQVAQASQISAQANVDQVAAETKRLRDEIAELEHERRVIREQFINTQVYIQGLVALIEPTPATSRDNG